MRIIAGKYKRTPLLTLEGESTRPTRDRVKEALFSSIDAEGEKFLDLFAGSGSIGLEALSREASDVVFNDSNPEAVKIISANLLKVKEKRRVFDYGYDLCIKKLKGETFDYIYLDPPYAFKDHERLLGMLKENGLVRKGSVVIAEVRKDTDLPEEVSSFTLFKEKRYGITKLYYYRYE